MSFYEIGLSDSDNFDFNNMYRRTVTYKGIRKHLTVKFKVFGESGFMILFIRIFLWLKGPCHALWVHRGNTVIYLIFLFKLQNRIINIPCYSEGG